MKLLKSNMAKILVLFLVFSCVDPIDIKTITYENYLVIEATITDEFKNHTIKLSRTFAIDTIAENPETNAQVRIVDDKNNSYLFNETAQGTYTSVNKFKALPNTSYTLKVATTNGNSYSSKPTVLTTPVQIEKLTTAIKTSTEGVDGVSISVHSFNPNNNANYYRYEYEETYQISPPFWSDEELKVVSANGPYIVEIVKRTVDNKDCYKTQYSKEILLTETKSLAEDRVNFPVRFILDSDFIISERYSILVKQYVQTFAAYNYYETLKKIASSQNVFAQSQPGFIAGNISSDADRNENVIGFFEVSSVSEKRLFFNYTDLFPNKTVPFPSDCDFVAPLLYDPFAKRSYLIELIQEGTYTFFKENDTGLAHLEGGYILVPKACGDCTVLGSNVKPSFWIE